MPVPRVLLSIPPDGLKTWDTIILHAMDAFKINVILVVGHDRLYSSMLGTMLKKRAKAEEARLESHDGNYMLFSRQERYHWACSNPNKQRQG
jgi:hypothetical protein